MKKTLYFLGLFILISVVAVSFYGPVYNKYIDLTYRFRMIEEQIKSYGRYIVRPIEIYQAQRGDAVISVGAKSIKSSDRNWKRVNQPWKENYFQKSKALEVWNGNLVVGLLGQVQGDASVYIFDGNTWRTLGEKDTVPGWETLDYVQVLRSFDGNLYAGINNEVWIFDEEDWKQVGISSHGKFPWGSEAAYSMRENEGSLYVGIMGKTGPRVYRLLNGLWVDTSKGLPKTGFDGVYELWSHTDGNLYAALAASNGSGSVYRKRTNEEIWEKVGGQGLNGSWISEGFRYGLSLASHEGSLVVSLSRHPKAIGKFSSIWAFNGKDWRPVGASTTPRKWGGGGTTLTL